MMDILNKIKDWCRCFILRAIAARHVLMDRNYILFSGDRESTFMKVYYRTNNSFARKCDKELDIIIWDDTQITSN